MGNKRDPCCHVDAKGKRRESGQVNARWFKRFRVTVFSC
jgi:hypothetical protein